MKITTFQELRHKCAELYCPKDWAIATWTKFFADCIKLHILNEVELNESILRLTETYNCSESLIKATITFQKDNGIIKDYKEN